MGAVRIAANGTELAVRVEGDGAPLVLLHGWPHTGRIWDGVRPAGRQCVVPDLRGLGESAPAAEGFDAATGAGDVLGVLDALGIGAAEVAAIDAAVPAAFLLGLEHPERVTRLVLMEGTLPGLPGGFDAPPWWFGFHAVPGLAEAVVAGREDEYLGFFLRDCPDGVRRELTDAYRTPDRLRAGFGFYRAMTANAELLRAAVAGRRLTVPTLALGGSVVGERLHRQLEPFADDLRGELLERCGHIVPLDRPDALDALFTPAGR